MLINVSFNITPCNQIKISRYIDSINWRITHITKRPVKKRLEFPQDRIDILTGNIRSNENPLNIRYGDSFLLDFQCNLINDSIRVSVNPSEHCQSALDGWISSAVWSFTLAEAPLWPEVVKSLQNVTWPICSVTIDTDDLHCRVGGIMRQSMSDINGFFCINEAAQTVNWNVPQVFPPRPPPPSHSPPPPPRPLVPALAAMVVHEDEDEFAFSQVVGLMLEGLDHVIDVINLQRLHVVCLINLVMTSLAMNMIH